MSDTSTPSTAIPSAARMVTKPVQVRAPGKAVRCGVVGVGRMGQHHARVYAQLPETELVGVVDANADRTGQISEKFNCPAMQTVDQLIETGVEAVSVAVPTIYHREVAEKLLGAGVACLIEKPLAKNVEDARAIKDAAERSGTVLMVGHIERFNPVMRAMQKAMASGHPVTPRFIEVSRVSPMTFRSVDVGVVMDMMIHDIDVILMLMGGQEPDEIQAAGVSVITQHEDICNARLTFRKPAITGGRTCVVNMTCSRLALKTERVTRITGENAYIKIDYATKQGLVIRRIANEIQMREMREQLRQGQDLTSLKWQELVNIEPLQVDDSEPIVAEIKAFLEAVTTGTPPPIDAEAGFVNVRTAERIVKAIKENQ